MKEEVEEVPEEKKKEKRTKKEKKENKKAKKTKQAAGPMHFTANNEPRALDVLGDLDPSIFNEVIIFIIIIRTKGNRVVIYILYALYSVKKK